jgi:hypothetical protein
MLTQLFAAVLHDANSITNIMTASVMARSCCCCWQVIKGWDECAVSAMNVQSACASLLTNGRHTAAAASAAGR